MTSEDKARRRIMSQKNFNRILESNEQFQKSKRYITHSIEFDLRNKMYIR